MRKLLLLLLLLASINSFSQNAYYDALNLVKWYRLKDNDPLKLAQADTVLAKLLSYGKRTQLRKTAENLFLAKVYMTADSLYTIKTTKQFLDPDVVVAGVVHTSVMLNEPLKRLRTELKQVLDKETDELPPLKSSFASAVEAYVNGQQGTDINSSLQDMETQAASIKGKAWETVKPIAELLRSMLSNTTEALARQSLVDSIKTKAPFLAAQINDVLDKSLLQRRLELRDSIYHLTIEGLQSNNADIKAIFISHDWPETAYKPSMQAALTTFKAKVMDAKAGYSHLLTANQQQLDNNVPDLKLLIQSQQTVAAAPASAPASLTDLNFPTQSQIIDALAIYVAKRMKEETALYFIENLGKVIKSDLLTQEMFPQTWRVMQSEDAYTSPRFGAKWRTAIAADFIAMPQNIATSSYIASRVKDPELQNYFADAVTFGTYVGRKYGFMDILQTLFNDHTKVKGKWTGIGVDVLHIMNQELYDTSSTKKGFWIAPQRFYKMDTAQLFCLYDLVRIKYHDQVGEGLKTIFDKSPAVRTQTSEVGQLYTELLMVLQQFYNAQSNPVKSADGTTVVQDGFWDSQRTFLDFLLNQSLIKLTPRERQALTVCKSSFFVYDYISNKNYIAAADQVMQIVGTLISGSPKVLINLDAKALAVLDKNDATRPLHKAIIAANDQFADLLLVQSLMDTLRNLPIGQVTSAYLQERFSFRGSHIPMPNANVAIAVSSLLGQWNSWEEELRKDVKLSYHKVDSIYREVLKNTTALSADLKADVESIKKDKLLYRNLKSLSDDALKTAIFFAGKENSSYFKWLSDFSEMLTEIASTTDSKALAKVIESYALPPGSYRLKRNSNFSLDLNAFPGLYAGGEQIIGSKEIRGVYGFTAPIGLSFSWGTRRGHINSDKDYRNMYISKKGKLKTRTLNNWSADLMVIDLAAPVSYRLGKGTEQGLPDQVTWAQVFSPGINLRRGIGSTPLCLGVGVQRTPNLRTDFTKAEKDAWRFHATIAFDLPLLNLHRVR